jgi:predicted Zn finger-like uncharacterized protein
MDVRCDRCQTEYELDDDSVADTGASVQCTTCGHTFVVRHASTTAIGLGTPPGGITDFAGSPSAPDWSLATEDGKTHRFRDLTTLQKWIVERRVTRGDRVCQRGGTWRRLGDVDELRPFFEVVEQADRSRAAEAAQGARPARQPSGRYDDGQGARAVHDPEHDMLASGRRPRPAVADSGAFDASFELDDEALESGFARHRSKLKIGVGLTIGVLAAVAAVLAFKGARGSQGPSGAAVAKAPEPAPPVLAAPPPLAAPPAAAPLPSAPQAAAPAPPAPAPPPAAPEAAAPPAAPVEPRAKAPAAVEAEAAPAKPRTYEQLVAEADRALENGHTNKAQKLYDDALKLQPEGVAAVTGSAYLLLDRHRTLAAIGLFKRALTNAPSFPPALFGLGEAYRSQGDNAQAIDAYKRYLSADPSGEDAPAARRQVRELGEALDNAARRPDNPSPPIGSAGDSKTP